LLPPAGGSKASASTDFSRSLVSKPPWQQALVLFAGIFSNFLLAGILFSITFFLGSPLATDSIPTKAREHMTEKMVILGVKKDSPAMKAGLNIGDTVVSIEADKEKIVNPTLAEFIAFTNKAGKTIHLSYLHGKTEMFTDIIPEENISLGRAFIGISPSPLISGKFNFFESIKYGFETAFLAAHDTLAMFGELFSGGYKSKVAIDFVVGPVGLVKITGIVSNIGIGYLLSFAGLISVSLAIVNLLPFPALDGGRLFFLLIEKIKGSRINPKFANMANMIGFSILILLMLLITYHDVIKLF
jgi:regulator of sigma E protease